MKRWLSLALILACAPALAQQPVSRPIKVLGQNINGGTPQSVLTQNQGRSYLAILNQSPTATIACAFGATVPTINGAGSITLLPLAGYVWDFGAGMVPNDPMKCVASVDTTPLTVLQ